MKFSKVLLISGSNVLLIAGVAMLASRGETPEVPFAYPEMVEQNSIENVGQDRVSAEALVTVGPVVKAPESDPVVPRTAPSKPEAPEQKDEPSAEKPKKAEPAQLMPAPTEFSLDAGSDDEIDAQPRTVRILAPGLSTATINRQDAFSVSVEAVETKPAGGVAAWPLFGNEYRAIDFSGYCQTVAYVKTSEGDFLWSPTLTDVQESDLADIQGALVDPLARKDVIGDVAGDAAFAWMVCMDASGARDKPFNSAAALARLDGVKLGPASRIAAARGD